MEIYSIYYNEYLISETFEKHLEIADFFGIDKYPIYIMHDCKDKIEKASIIYKDFMENGGYLDCDSIDEYLTMKKIFNENKNIMPIQFLTIKQSNIHENYEIVMITRNDFIPVYNKYCNIKYVKSCGINNVKYSLNKNDKKFELTIGDEININLLRILSLIPFLYERLNNIDVMINKNITDIGTNLYTKKEMIDIIDEYDEIKIYKNIMESYLHLISCIYSCEETNYHDENQIREEFNKFINHFKNMCYGFTIKHNELEFEIDKNKLKESKPILSDDNIGVDFNDEGYFYRTYLNLHLGFYKI